MTARKNATRPLLNAPASDPTETTIALVPIPDSTEYKRMLLGLIKVASTWLNYTRSGTDREAQVARIWRDIYMTISFDLCALIAECIATNQAVQDALRDAGFNQGTPNNNSDSGLGVGDGNLFQNLNCDLDSIYGYCVAIEDYIHQVSIDLLEAISDAPNLASTIARIVDFIPIVGDLPVLDDLNDIVNWIQGKGIASYNAGYTTTMRQDNICGLFALACSDCDLSPADVAIFYGSLGGITISFGDIWKVIALALTDLLSDTAFAYGIHALVASTLAVGGEVKGLVGLRGLATVASSGDPDSDWQIFCDPCQDCYVWDFGSAQRGWIIDFNGIGGTYLPSGGWQTTTQSAGQQQASVASPNGDILFPANEAIEITLRINAQNVQSSPNNVIILYDKNQNLLAPTQVMSNGVNDYVFNVNHSSDTDVWIILRASVNGSGVATLGRVTIRGDLTNAVLSGGESC